jgi:hypothetical protein
MSMKEAGVASHGRSTSFNHRLSLPPISIPTACHRHRLMLRIPPQGQVVGHEAEVEEGLKPQAWPAERALVEMAKGCPGVADELER